MRRDLVDRQSPPELVAVVRRQSSIDRSRLPFALFGIGPYHLAQFKVAICGLDEKPAIRAVGPLEDGPCVRPTGSENPQPCPSQRIAPSAHRSELTPP
jgi:hypothetical protein